VWPLSERFATNQAKRRARLSRRSLIKSKSPVIGQDGQAKSQPLWLLLTPTAGLRFVLQPLGLLVIAQNRFLSTAVMNTRELLGQIKANFSSAKTLFQVSDYLLVSRATSANYDGQV